MDGLFTMDDLNSFFSPYKILPIAQENKYLGIFFLFYHGIVCWVYSLELPNEYTQHAIILLKIENISLNYQPASVAQLDAPSDWRPGGRGFNPCRGR